MTKCNALFALCPMKQCLPKGRALLHRANFAVLCSLKAKLIFFSFKSSRVTADFGEGFGRVTYRSERPFPGWCVDIVRWFGNSAAAQAVHTREWHLLFTNTATWTLGRCARCAIAHCATNLRLAPLLVPRPPLRRGHLRAGPRQRRPLRRAWAALALPWP